MVDYDALINMSHRLSKTTWKRWDDDEHFYIEVTIPTQTDDEFVSVIFSFDTFGRAISLKSNSSGEKGGIDDDDREST